MTMTFVTSNYKPARTFNNLFNEILNDFPAFNGHTANSFPPVNIAETADGYHLELNAPGRSKEDFKVSVDNDLLTISYEKKEEVKTEGVKSVRKEFSFQSFKRSFNLDSVINAADIQAKYENGLLKLLLPKKADVKPAAKEVTIQ
jgi:HSP20 family protein